MAEAADELLAELLDRVQRLGKRDFSALDAITQRTDMVLRRAFGDDSDYRTRLGRINFSPMVAPSTEDYKDATWRGGVRELKNLIETAMEERLLFGVKSPAAQRDNEAIALAPGEAPTVFIVHGHDELLKEQVARFLQKLGCSEVILHEQPNRGRTIIEKFEEESAPAAFAVVLLTPDDVGGAVGKEQSKRARQNVIFELGYFVGALGRARVAALMDGQVDKPGDYDGVVWISTDTEWRLDLAREMKAAGLPIDLNEAV